MDLVYTDLLEGLRPRLRKAVDLLVSPLLLVTTLIKCLDLQHQRHPMVLYYYYVPS